MSLSASEMRTCTQLGRMLIVPDSHVIVCTTSVAKVKHMMSAMTKFAGTDDSVTFLSQPHFTVRHKDGGRIRFRAVPRNLDEFLGEVTGFNFTNIVYDFMLGAQIPKLCRVLKYHLRSATYRGSFTIEPLEE